VIKTADSLVTRIERSVDHGLGMLEFILASKYNVKYLQVAVTELRNLTRVRGPREDQIEISNDEEYAMLLIGELVSTYEPPRVRLEGSLEGSGGEPIEKSGVVRHGLGIDDMVP
jgi:hypothetical protein